MPRQQLHSTQAWAHDSKPTPPVPNHPPPPLPPNAAQAAAVFEWKQAGNYGAAKKLFREGQDACLPHAPLLAANAK